MAVDMLIRHGHHGGSSPHVGIVPRLSVMVHAPHSSPRIARSHAPRVETLLFAERSRENRRSRLNLNRCFSPQSGEKARGFRA